MPITLATRQIIVERMDKQFNDDLRMRKETNTISKDSFSLTTKTGIQYLISSDVNNFFI